MPRHKRARKDFSVDNGSRNERHTSGKQNYRQKRRAGTEFSDNHNASGSSSFVETESSNELGIL